MQQPLGDGVQHGVVVLVHLAQLALAEPVGLPADAPRDQPVPSPDSRAATRPGEQQAGSWARTCSPTADLRMPTETSATTRPPVA